jgi:protein-L-isoaspartate(D-aspartate) O-methyltransferase
MTDFAAERERMIERTIVRRGLDDPALIAAFRAVPREAFVAAELAARAYADAPLPIESGQTISQPYIVALTIDAAAIGPDSKVLEIGAGSGYAAGILGQMAREVFAIERHRELAELARERMRRLGYANVHIVEGDGTCGWPAEAPFDAIVAAASGSHVPTVLVDQLRPGGRIVMPIGGKHSVQSLVQLTKREDGGLDRRDLGAVRFVPLIGEHAFPERG